MTGGAMAGFITRAAQVLGVNAVPVAGVIGEWWSSGTALALYWIESMLVIVLMSARIVLHRRWTRKAGHWQRAQFKARTDAGRAQPGPGSFLGSYLIVALTFTLAHGVFLGVLLFMLGHNRPDLGIAVEPAGLRTGLIGMSAFLAIGFLIDLVSLGRRPFRWIELLTQRALGRIFVLHLVIIFGVATLAMTDSPMGLLGLFAGLKAMVEIGALFPDKELALTPPRWLRWMDRIPSKDGESFSAYWRRTEEADRRRREANERTIAPPH